MVPRYHPVADGREGVCRPLALAVTGCSGSSNVYGNWTAPDGSSAFINSNGLCSGMYYNNGAPLDIGGGETCSYSGNTLVVSQQPNQITYQVQLSGSTMTLTAGSETINFTKS